METVAAQVVEAPPADGPEGVPAAGRRADVVLRVVCHVAAELPVLLFAVVELARGWRPVYDNAGLSLRSWEVLGGHPPLVGHQMAVSVGGHAVFGPGPLQNWILAVPVRIDPAQGALWGGALAVVVAIALAVEASWATGGWPAGATAAGAFLVFALVRPELVLDVVWNVWFALLFLVTTFCTAAAVATGRLRWWPVCVAAASVVVQCQVAFAPPAVALVVVAPLVGLAVRRRRHEGVGGAWWMVGLGLGALSWALPVVQEATASPGNLTLLVRAAGGSGPTIGTTAALRALGGATRMLPDWIRPLPGGGGLAQFVGEANIVSGPGWWGPGGPRPAGGGGRGRLARTPHRPLCPGHPVVGAGPRFGGHGGHHPGGAVPGGGLSGRRADPDGHRRVGDLRAGGRDRRHRDGAATGRRRRRRRGPARRSRPVCGGRPAPSWWACRPGWWCSASGRWTGRRRRCRGGRPFATPTRRRRRRRGWPPGVPSDSRWARPARWPSPSWPARRTS